MASSTASMRDESAFLIESGSSWSCCSDVEIAVRMSSDDSCPACANVTKHGPSAWSFGQLCDRRGVWYSELVSCARIASSLKCLDLKTGFP